MIQEHTIIHKGNGIFEVINEITKRKYEVDLYLNKCSCESWKYCKNKKGKKNCKHLKLVRGLK